MPRLRLVAVLVFIAGGAAAGAGFQAGRPWPPAVQRVSDESPVLSPAEELKTIVMLHCERLPVNNADLAR